MSQQQQRAMGWAIEEALSRRGQVTFTARGRSMLPSIWPGSRVSVRRCAADELRTGDVVFFRDGGGELRLHRLLGQHAGRLRTRGDNQQQELAVAHDQVLGRLEATSLGPLGPALPLAGRLRSLGAGRIVLSRLANRGLRVLQTASAPGRALWRGLRSRPRAD